MQKSPRGEAEDGGPAREVGAGAGPGLLASAQRHVAVFVQVQAVETGG